MTSSVFNSLLYFVFGFINLLLYPINIFISSYLPDLNFALNSLSNFLTLFVSEYFSYILDFLFIPHQVIELTLSYLIFRLSVPLLVYGIKIAIKWYYMIKP